MRRRVSASFEHFLAHLALKSDLVCPNCKAINLPGARICSACGIHLDTVNAVLPRLQEYEQERDTAHAEQAQQQASAKASSELQQANARFRLLIIITLVVAGVLAVIVVTAALVAAWQVRVRQDHLEQQYGKAYECLQARDFLCARDGFFDLLSEEPDYPSARQHLEQARLGLAEEFAAAGLFASAERELLILLEESPELVPALTLLQSVYNRWYQLTINQGDLITALQLRLKIRALQNKPSKEIP